MARHHRPSTEYIGSDNVGHDIQLHPWTTYTIGRRWAGHVVITLVVHTRLDDVGRGNAIIVLMQHTRWDDVDVACHHHPRATNTIGRCRVFDTIIALG